MAILIRAVERKDIVAMNKWRLGHGEGAIQNILLPPTGLISDDTAIGFLYLTNSTAAWIENIASNPEATPTKVGEAIDEVIEGLVEMSKGYGVLEICGLTKKNSVGKWVERLGFTKGADDYTVVSRRI